MNLCCDASEFLGICALMFDVVDAEKNMDANMTYSFYSSFNNYILASGMV